MKKLCLAKEIVKDTVELWHSKVVDYRNDIFNKEFSSKFTYGLLSWSGKTFLQKQNNTMNLG